MKERIASLLRFEKWSPELISKRLALDDEICVSHETIYQWIWKAKKSKKKIDLQYSNLYKDFKHRSRRQKEGTQRINEELSRIVWVLISVPK